MTLRKKRTDPDGVERLTTLISVDAKKTLARIAFETETTAAEIVRELIDDWLMKTTLPTGVQLPRRLEQLRAARKEKRA